MNKILTPSSLKYPVFLMNFPFTIDNKFPNNVLMQNFSEPYDLDRAFDQFMVLYNEIATQSLVCILPSEKRFQDLPFVANIGCYLPHLDIDLILLSNFHSAPRIGEEVIGAKFFKSMNYDIIKCPFYFEGEADLKYIRDNIYVSPYGMRTSLQSHMWMRSKLEMNIISIELSDPKLYHLDCVLFPLTSEKIIASTCVMNEIEIKELEKYVEIVDVPKDRIYNGWTNVVKIGNKVLHASDQTNDEIKEFFFAHGFDTIPIKLDEFDKSGADLSCLVMHLNY